MVGQLLLALLFWYQGNRWTLGLVGTTMLLGELAQVVPDDNGAFEIHMLNIDWGRAATSICLAAEGIFIHYGYSQPQRALLRALGGRGLDVRLRRPDLLRREAVRQCLNARQEGLELGDAHVARSGSTHREDRQDRTAQSGAPEACS